MDVSGEHQLDVDHNIYKKRLAPDGKAIGIEKGGDYILFFIAENGFFVLYVAVLIYIMF